MSIEAMKQAVEAFEAIKKYVTDDGAMPENWDAYHEEEYYALEALRQAIEQAEKQEPVDIHCPSCLHSFAVVPVAKREFVGLTDEEIAQTVGSPIDEVYLADFHRVIEKLRSKNT
jgi:hypothetical protein